MQILANIQPYSVCTLKKIPNCVIFLYTNQK